MNYAIDSIKNYDKKRGWILGQFFSKNKLNHSKAVEVKYHELKPGHSSQEHFHPIGRELIIVVKGKLIWQLNGRKKILSEGDFIIMNNNVKEALIKVLEPSATVCIRTPSVPNNKIGVTNRK